jgi:hypothetical protein
MRTVDTLSFPKDEQYLIMLSRLQTLLRGRTRGRILLIGLIGILLMTASIESFAQVSDEVREAAMRDVHGEDMRGNDGPAASAGMDLLLLYHAHQSGEISASSGMENVQGIKVQNGRVPVDIVAVEQGEALVEDLSGLGGQNVAARGRMVSAELPISAIREVALLDGVQQMRPARAATRDRPNDPRNTLENAIAERGTTAVMSEDTGDVQPSQQGGEGISSEANEVPDAATNMESGEDRTDTAGPRSSGSETDISREEAANPRPNPNPDVEAERGTGADRSTSSRENGSGAIGFFFLVIFILVLADPR